MASNAENVSIWWRHHEYDHDSPAANEVILEDMGNVDQITNVRQNTT